MFSNLLVADTKKVKFWPQQQNLSIKKLVFFIQLEWALKHFGLNKLDSAAVKMSFNKVTLSWNDFESSASNTIRRLWLDQDFSDVTLVTEDERQFTAHKVVLITGSQLFRNLFTAAAHPSPLLFLPGVRSEQLKLFLEFLYIGECQLPEQDLKEFFAVAAKLKISGLVEDIDNIEEQQRSGSHEDKTGSRHEGNPKDVPLVEEPEFIVDNENRIADERKVSSSPQKKKCHKRASKRIRRTKT